MIGEVLGKRYKVISKLGSGGMSEVYKGLDTLLDRQVTIKILRQQYASDLDFVRRFRSEAQAVARLSHPNIVSIYDVGIEQDIQYLVMEYVDGVNLKEYLATKDFLDGEEVVAIGVQICDALEHAHSNNIIHRDIKPHNILITRTGKVKVTDFGIARAVTKATITYNGGLMGSVHYLSPEQAKGELTDQKSDLYSAGVVLYELSTGQLPYQGESPITIALKHIQETPQKPTSINSDVPKGLEDVILRAMSREKEKRFDSAAQMRYYLEKVPNNLTQPSKYEEMDKDGAVKKRLKPLAWILLGLLIMASLIAGFVIAKGLLTVDEVEVPLLIGKKIDEAAIILQRKGLVLEIDSKRYHPTIPAEHIIDQVPKQDNLVRKGRTVQVDVSLGQKQVLVPDVVGHTLRAAIIEIENANFLVSDIVDEVFDDTQPEGKIVAQSPMGGEQRSEGTTISLVLSKGSKPEYIEMPDLQGLPLAKAEQLLEEKDLKIELVSYQESDTFFTGQVISQDIAPGEKILQKSTIYLVVSRGPGPKAETAGISIAIPNDGKEHLIKIVVEDLKGTRQEYLKKHEAGDFFRTSITFYGQGIIKVYQDDILIEEESVPS